MAQEISVGGNKKLKTFQKEFNKLFPYLGIKFFTEEEIQKGKDGKSMISIDTEKTIKDVRTKQNTEELTVVGQVHVGQLEKRFHKLYGIHVQICVQDKEGQDYYTGEEFDKVTLTQMNNQMKEQGFVKFKI